MKSLLDLLDLPEGAALLYCGSEHKSNINSKMVYEIQPSMEIVKDLIIYEDGVIIKLAGSQYDAQIFTEPVKKVLPFCDKLSLFAGNDDNETEYLFKVIQSKFLIDFDMFEAIEDLADIFREYGVEVW